MDQQHTCTRQVDEFCHGEKMISNQVIKSLLGDSEALQSMSFEMVALVSKLCPEHQDQFSDLMEKHFNANCGPLHRWTKNYLDEQDEPAKETDPKTV